MWIRRQTPAQARMPSMRPRALNPRTPARPEPPSSQPVSPARGDARSAAQQAPTPPENAADEATRAGGFHESSYELQHGLLVSESEWPDDVTVPGELGDK
jgi:hypothetical protein